jgi:hypothetical protein
VSPYLGLNCKPSMQSVKNEHCVGFKAFTAMNIKRSIFWDITSCSPIKVNRRFKVSPPSLMPENGESKKRGSTVCRMILVVFLLGLRQYNPENTRFRQILC